MKINSSNLALLQIQAQRQQLAQQAQATVPVYPELASQFQIMDKQLEYQGDMIQYTNQFNGNSIGAEEVANLDGYISDLGFALEMIDVKKTVLQYQAQTNQGSASQYQAQISQLDSEAQGYLKQLSNANQEKTNLINSYTNQSSQTNTENQAQPNILDLFLALLGLSKPDEKTAIPAETAEVSTEKADESQSSVTESIAENNAKFIAKMIGATPTFNTFDTNKDGIVSMEEAYIPPQK